MYGYLIKFNSMPKPGFALHCKFSNYYKQFTPEQKGFEIVYVKKGTITLEYETNHWIAPQGSILFLKRNLPFVLYTKNNEISEHSSVQLLSDFDVTLSKDLDTDYASFNDALSLPFLLYPCDVNEQIMKKMNSIISGKGSFFSDNDMNASIVLSSILYDVSQGWNAQKKANDKSPSILCYKIKKIITNNMDYNITLDYLAKELNRTPNYLNFVFKKETGTTIHNYINKEKIRIICEFILSNILNFNDACNAVGISDVSYGYRLFKKHTGLTPKEFTNSQTYEKYKAKNYTFI